jgi:hypothetical protein
MGTGVIDSHVNRKESEADRSPPSSAEVMNGGVIPANPMNFSYLCGVHPVALFTYTI